MIYITQLIYVKAGQEPVFHQFEDFAIPLIRKYNGNLLLRIRPDKKEIIEAAGQTPYEIHLIEFGADADFQDFMADEDRKQFLHLKEQSVSSAILLKGIRI